MSLIDNIPDYRRVITYLVLAITICFVYTTVCAQQNPKDENNTNELNVSFVNKRSEVNVFLKLRTSDDPLFFVYFSESWDGTKYLVPLSGSNLEVKTAQGWREVKQRTDIDYLGGVVLDVLLNATIKPNSEAEFVFTFSRIHFEVDPGQQLRVVVDAWKNRESMLNGDEPIKLYSQPFICPDIGILP